MTATASSSRRRPRATYRLQFNKDFRFDDAARIIPYLTRLGISHVYASPILAARPGSTHGYDIVDHNVINPEIGDRASFDRFVELLHANDMGLILDFVPNHMGVGSDNPWWWDVLEWGQQSRYANFFDIDWQPLEPTLLGKVLLPILGDHYGAVIDRGELQLSFEEEAGAFVIRYWDTRLPISPREYGALLVAASASDEDELGRLGDAFGKCTHNLSVPEMRDEVETLKRRLGDLAASDAGAKQRIQQAVEALNGTPGDRGSFDRLHQLLERQAYRLAFWRVAAFEINYRRFFDINDLASLRMEVRELFDASHARIKELLVAGQIDGLRLDHIDGLRDPEQYFERLHGLASDASDAPLYILVEKILAHHEALRADWAISGTTGYEFLAEVNGLFVSPDGEKPLTRYYGRFTGRNDDPAVMAPQAKRQIMRETLASELNVLSNRFNRLAKQSRNTRDYSLTGLREALANVIAHFPVYRTYVTERGTAREDRRDIEWAVGSAKRAARTPDHSIYDFIQKVLTLDLTREETDHVSADVADAAVRFQQYTGPVMAKAMEDTTFYRSFRFVSLNEVGGEPWLFGTSLAAFNEENRRRLGEHPHSMLATATHDHKRGEDVRARLNVISETPREWRRRVQRWSQLNKRKRREVNSRPAPDRNDEYLFYQTIVGAWPLDLTSPDFVGMESFRDRIDAYMLKAVREAKLHSSWAAPAEEYEDALSDFVRRTLDPRESRPVLEDIAVFVDSLAPTGAVNGLSQTLLKLTSPGVPDTYQGAEFWDLSLVDPDNRRPVDYEARIASLVTSQPPGQLLADWRSGAIKQHVIAQVLALRARCPELFAKGDYRPLEIRGVHADRAIAFARTEGDVIAVTIVPRFVRSLVGERTTPLPTGWDDTEIDLSELNLPGHEGREILTGRGLIFTDGKVRIGSVLDELPIGLLLFGGSRSA